MQNEPIIRGTRNSNHHKVHPSGQLLLFVLSRRSLKAGWPISTPRERACVTPPTAPANITGLYYVNRDAGEIHQNVKIRKLKSPLILNGEIILTMILDSSPLEADILTHDN